MIRRLSHSNAAVLYIVSRHNFGDFMLIVWAKCLNDSFQFFSTFNKILLKNAVLCPSYFLWQTSVLLLGKHRKKTYVYKAYLKNVQFYMDNLN